LGASVVGATVLSNSREDPAEELIRDQASCMRQDA
jgi:hypothetical protein